MCANKLFSLTVVSLCVSSLQSEEDSSSFSAQTIVIDIDKLGSCVRGQRNGYMTKQTTRKITNKYRYTTLLLEQSLATKPTPA